MSNFSCTCKSSCVGLAVLVSLIIGIVTAFLTITATITVAPVFLWVLGGIAVVYLGVLLLGTLLGRRTVGGCLCNALPSVLLGILGTILTAVILLAFTFAATSILGAIITGLLLFFFSLFITATACLIRCAASCEE